MIWVHQNDPEIYICSYWHNNKRLISDLVIVESDADDCLNRTQKPDLQYIKYG